MIEVVLGRNGVDKTTILSMLALAATALQGGSLRASGTRRQSIYRLLLSYGGDHVVEEVNSTSRWRQHLGETSTLGT